VHGDAVNSAARLEQLNKEYGTSTIISESTMTLLRDEYPISAIGEVPIRGKRDSIQIFKLDTKPEQENVAAVSVLDNATPSV
jgi:adenylate cyclase